VSVAGSMGSWRNREGPLGTVVLLRKTGAGGGRLETIIAGRLVRRHRE